MGLRASVCGFFLLAAVALLLPPAATAEVPTEEGTGTAQPGYLPEMFVESQWGEEVFGGRTGYIHPFLSVEEHYTDNLFNEADEEEDEFITVISPGIWLAFPAGARQPLRITTLNSAPGGLGVTRFPIETARRLQGYALYRADITEHKNFPEEDNVYQRAEGLLNYNFRGGLSLELIDVFEIGQDPYSTGESEREVDEFTSNLAQFLVDYKLGAKTRLRADLTSFKLDYDEDRNEYREREDSGVALYLFYRFLPKTSLLLEFDYVDIDYQEEDPADGRGGLPDSRQKSAFTGLRWVSSEKTQALLKLGHNWRDIDGSGSREDFIGEVRLNYRISPKTSTSLTFTRRVEETDVRGANSILSHRAQLAYRQDLTTRWNASVELYGYRDDYRGAVLVAGVPENREDDYLGGRLAVGYLFRRWLNFGVGYNLVRRDSNIPRYDYTNNTVFVTATAAL